MLQQLSQNLTTKAKFQSSKGHFWYYIIYVKFKIQGLANFMRLFKVINTYTYTDFRHKGSPSTNSSIGFQTLNEIEAAVLAFSNRFK